MKLTFSVLPPILLALLLAGCVLQPSNQPADGRDGVQSEPSISCGSDRRFSVVGRDGSCAWTTLERSDSFAAIELVVGTHDRYAMRNENIFNWSATKAVYVHGFLGETRNGVGFTGSWDSRVAGTTCLVGHRSMHDCPHEGLSKNDTWRFDHTPLAGRYLLFVAGYGVDEAIMRTELASNTSLIVGQLAAGKSELLLATEGIGTPGEAAVNVSVERNAFFDIGEAGHIRTTEVVISNDAGQKWVFQRPSGEGRWFGPAQWGDDRWTANPNMGVGPGTWTISATWQTSSDPNARPGVPVVGIIRDPFFVEADGRLRPYGPYEASA